MLYPIDLESARPKAIESYPAVLRALVPEIVDEVNKRMRHRAHEVLGSSLPDYLEGLEPVTHHAVSSLTGSVVASIALKGVLPNLLEHGAPGGPMKGSLLSGTQLRNAQGRPYARIPIRESGGGGAFIPVGTEAPMHGLRARSLGNTAARRHHAGAPTVAKGRKRQGRQRRGGSRKASQFRTVTPDSPGFIHPGIEAADLFEEAQAYAGEVTGRLLEQALEGAVRGSP